MDPLSIAGTLIAVLQVTVSVISVCYDYRQGTKNAGREVIQLFDELNSLKDVLEALLKLVEDTETSNPARLKTFELVAKQEGPIYTCQTELERLKVKLEPESGWKALRRTLVWPLSEGDMKKALSNLERLKSTMQLALSADQTSLSLEIHDNLQDLTRLFQRHSTNETLQHIYVWLAAPDPYENHVTSRKKRQPNTGTWLLTSKSYEHWLLSSKSFMWLYGIPGAGKTVLCSTIIESLVRYCHKIPRTAMAYFYFDFNDTNKRSVSSLVRSLITQLSGQNEIVPPTLLKLYESHQNGATSADNEALIAAFRDLLLMYNTVYIVLDALDESSDCEEVLSFIDTVQTWDLSRVHFLATSRPLSIIEEVLSDLASDKICLENSRMNDDVKVYIMVTLATDKTMAKWPTELRAQIQEKLLVEEGGMFRWVVCQLDMLRRCMSVAAIRKAMTVLPKSLDETYEQILLGINETYQPDVMKVLQALTVAAEPLTLEEIVEILAVDLDSSPPQFDPESRLLDPRSILSMCSSLVTNNSETRGKASTLRLAHASVADYLIKPKSSLFHFSKESARQFLAQTCLVYVLNPEFAKGHNRGLMLDRLKAFPFLSHAFRYWPQYLQRGEEEKEDRLTMETKKLLEALFATSKLPNGGNWAFWVGMMIPSTSDHYIRDTPPLYYAASFGLTEVVKLILESNKDIDVDVRGGRAYSSPLHVAVFRNHVDIVRILLEKGANPSLQNSHREAPLYWASEDARQLLLQYNAKPEDAYKRLR